MNGAWRIADILVHAERFDNRLRPVIGFDRSEIAPEQCRRHLIFRMQTSADDIDGGLHGHERVFENQVIGLSKINRIVDYYSKRPQVQERLTMQIVDALKMALGTKDVACIIDAKHLCVNCRGIKDTASSTITAELSGIFRTNAITRQEFLHYVGSHAKFD